MSDYPHLDSLIDEGPSAVVTTEVWEEIRDNLGGGAIVTAQSVAVTLNSAAGVLVTIADMGSSSYDFAFSIEHDENVDTIGAISFEIISATQFKIYNSGSNTTSKVKVKILPIAFAKARGTATLNSNTGVSVTIADMGTTDFDVFVWLENGPGIENVGYISHRIDSATQFTLFNSGSDNTSTVHFWAVTR